MKNLSTTLLTLGLGLTLASSSFAQKIYWTDSSTQKIQRSDLDGSNIEDLVTAPSITQPSSIAVDLTNSKMYWADNGADKIQRSDLDGSNIEDLVTTGINTPSGIALDLPNSKMYWSDESAKIQRSDLDGSNVEDVITFASGGVLGPTGIELDLTNSKMYWADIFFDKIQRSDLDGSNIEDLVLGLPAVRDIALDLTNSKMYWTDFSGNKIQRANLDGSNVEDIVSIAIGTPYGIVLDATNSKIYWTISNSKKIQRANLDGSNVEDVLNSLDGLVSPLGITLGTFDSPLSVELNSFSVHQIGKTIGLNWSTASETENAGFNVYRKIGNSEFVQISSYENNSELVGSLNTSSNSFYTFVDNSNFKDNELYTYYISDIETNGKETKHTELAQSVVYEIKSQVVDRFQLKQNFPNPFNPSTTISYNLGESVDVSLTIYNEKGEFVKELVNENQSQGSHEVVWNGTDSFGKEVSSGTYFYKIETESFTRSHKMILLK